MKQEVDLVMENVKRNGHTKSKMKKKINKMK